jgi:glycosyltransferase involved in cell wall biosynthesis
MMRRSQSTDLPNPPRHKSGWPWITETLSVAATVQDGITWPRISIVTPSYNQGRFLEETVRSVLHQGYPNLEYVVVDGGSTDDSSEIIKKYAPWLTYWVSEPDHGQSDAINKGFDRVTGQILGWLNSDDFLAPNALHKVANAFFRARRQVGAIVGKGHKIDATGRDLYSPLPERVTQKTLFEWCNGPNYNFMQPACFFTRDAWISSGPLRLDLDFCMDLALWFKMAERYEFEILNESLAFCNTHANAKTTKERAHMFGEIALLMATQSDGWAHGRALLFKTLDELNQQKTMKQLIRSNIRGIWR